MQAQKTLTSQSNPEPKEQFWRYHYSWRSLKKLKIELPYDPAIPLLGRYPKECAPGYDRATCTLMFIAGLFTVAKSWKQCRCPTTDEWTKNMWYIYIMEFYSAIKNEIMLFAGK
jgi:hypothetical protein